MERVEAPSLLSKFITALAERTTPRPFSPRAGRRLG